jgi:hypothetical protein
VVKGLEDQADLVAQKALEEEVKSTRALIQTFLQTLKAFRIYEANHPLLSKFQDRLKHDFEATLMNLIPFPTGGEHPLLLRKEHEAKMKESLAFVFLRWHREIRFFKGSSSESSSISFRS